MRFESAVLLAGLLLFTACDSPSGPGEEVRRICDDGTVLTASGDPLEFAWSPDCSVFSLAVDGPGVVWAVSAPSHEISSPVRYGVTPDGALSLGFAEPMVDGEEYLITLEVSPEPFARDTVATATYVP